MVEQLMNLPEGTRLMLLAPFVRDQKGEHKHIFEQIKKAGFARVRVDGTVMDLNEAQKLNLDKQKKHSVDVVVDRITVSKNDKSRMSESLEKALDLGDGLVVVHKPEEKNPQKADVTLSQNFACPDGHM